MSAATSLDLGPVDPAADLPLQRQIYLIVRNAVVEGRLRSGLRLPSSRQLARQMGVSRKIVVAAFERLAAEGYLRSRVGSGTFVAGGHVQRRPKTAAAGSVMSRWARGVVSAPQRGRGRLTPGATLVDAFPRQRWFQMMRRSSVDAALDAGGPDSLLGLLQLRRAIAESIAPMRGIVCSPEEVVITATVEQAVQAAVRLVCEPDDTVVIEDPTEPLVRAAISALPVRVQGAAIDLEGIRIPVAGQPPRVLYTTPIAQQPLGVAMTTLRRRQLLDWASRHAVTVIEDDRDAGLSGGPRSLRAIDHGGVVIHCGSFQKTLIPGISIAFAIVPEAIAEDFARIVRLSGSVATTDQAVLAEWIAGGGYARHLRRLRALHIERFEAMQSAVMTQLAPVVTSCAPGSALEMLAWLAPGFSDVEIAAIPEVRQSGIVALASYASGVQLPPALVIGYGAVPAAEAACAISDISRGVHEWPRAAGRMTS